MCDNCSSKCSTKIGEEFTLPKITSAFLILTERCNLSCRYCWLRQNPVDMTFEVALDAIKFLIKNAEEQGDTPSINFFGGEPLLKWKEVIVPIVSYIRNEYNLPFKINMTSNCILMTEDKLRFMKENGVGLLFSIDGDKETQDYNRPCANGKGSFDLLEEKIKIIPKYYPKMTFRSTITKEMVHNVFHNVKFGFDSGFRRVYAIPNVFSAWDYEEKEELKRQLTMIGDYFIQGMREGKKTLYINLEEKIRDIIQINRVVTKRERKPLSKCGLGMNKSASINPDGTVLGCQEMASYKDDTFIIGDIYNGTNDELRKKLIYKFLSHPVVGTDCETCMYNPICDGGCVANNYLINKNLSEMPPMMCFWNQILLEEAIRVTTILGNENNKMFKEMYFHGKRLVGDETE